MSSHRIYEAGDFSITYEPVDKEYRVRVYDDKAFIKACKFPAFVDNLEPIAYAHWVYADEDGMWFANPGYMFIIDRKPICSHCGTKFDQIVERYRRCPECGAHMLATKGDIKHVRFY